MTQAAVARCPTCWRAPLAVHRNGTLVNHKRVTFHGMMPCPSGGLKVTPDMKVYRTFRGLLTAERAVGEANAQEAAQRRSQAVTGPHRPSRIGPSS